MKKIDIEKIHTTPMGFEAIPEIGKAIEVKYPELKCAVPEYCFIVYLDGEHKEKEADWLTEIQVPIVRR